MFCAGPVDIGAFGEAEQMLGFDAMSMAVRPMTVTVLSGARMDVPLRTGTMIMIVRARGMRRMPMPMGRSCSGPGRIAPGTHLHRFLPKWLYGRHGG